MKFKTAPWLALILVGCSSGPPKLPYPAFVDVTELSNVFIAGLPGVRSKQLAGDPRSRRTSNRVQLPSNWEFSTGASPAQSVEIFVLSGEVRVGEFSLTAGGYAYIPPGTTGFPMRSESGAFILYFLDGANEQAVIQTPIISNMDLLDWQTDGVGYATKDLRLDPGSGARTWLLKMEPEAMKSWQRSTQTVEGYLLSGAMIDSECVDGKVVTAEYQSGHYFYRPPGAINGGPAASTSEIAVWLLRVSGKDVVETVAGCMPTETQLQGE